MLNPLGLLGEKRWVEWGEIYEKGFQVLFSDFIYLFIYLLIYFI